MSRSLYTLKVHLMKTLSLILLAVFFANPFHSPNALAVEPTADSLEAIKKNIDDKKAVLVDVRELNEWNDGHLQDASHLALKKIREGIDQEEFAKIAPPGKIVYLHCASGFRCMEAAESLKTQHKDLRPMKQGYKALLKAGFPKSP
jgi:phage shock protein E